MSKTRLLVCVLVVAAICALVYWKVYWNMPEPPRTLEQAEREEREIMAGTRRGRPVPAELQEERLQQRQRNEAEQLVTLFKRCHDAVRRDFVLTRDVTVDDGLLPPNGYLYLSTYRGERIVGISDRPPDPAYYAELVPPLSGSYVVSGSVRSGSGPSARYQSYTCRILVKPPFYLVRSVEVYANR